MKRGESPPKWEGVPAAAASLGQVQLGDEDAIPATIYNQLGLQVDGMRAVFARRSQRISCKIFPAEVVEFSRSWVAGREGLIAHRTTRQANAPAAFV